MASDRSLDSVLDERSQLRDSRHGPDGEEPPTPGSSSAALPPGMQRTKDYSVDDLVNEMKRVPLFMTSMDDVDVEGGENVELEALKALAYEGTRAEIAQNFRDQGTELVRTEKRYREAREYYTKALDALKAPAVPPDPDQGPAVIEIDEEAEVIEERSIEEACLVNRALCNLEMKNYGSCNRDCAAALRLNPRNVKAWYRAAAACLALNKVAEALDACQSGLKFESQNSALKALMTRINQRKEHLAALEKTRIDREVRRRTEQATLQLALKDRKIVNRSTDRPPEMPEAAIALEDPVDASSTLSVPVMILYPVHAQTDFIKQFQETESLNNHLSYILPVPWDEEHEYTSGNVECYMETSEGGLIKAGKKLSMLKLLSSGKLEVLDGLVKVFVVPKDKASTWIEDFKKRRGRN